MKKKIRSLIFWLISVILTLLLVMYQYATGPTHPQKGKVEINNKQIRFQLPRSQRKSGDAVIKFEVKDKSIKGTCKYKRYKTSDEWIEKELLRDGDFLIALLPEQPPAGKIAYDVSFDLDGRIYMLSEEPVIFRFKGEVPLFIVILHVSMILASFLFSMRTGIEALVKGKYLFSYTIVTSVVLLFGGLVFGPIMQKYAFGEYWTGWPFGKDVTDTKTLVAFVFWVIAFIKLLKNREKRGWALVAAIILLIVFLIPHSMFGSEFDYESGTVVTG